MFEWLSDGRILLEAIGGLFSHPAFALESLGLESPNLNTALGRKESS
jgi:hypothetical protein